MPEPLHLDVDAPEVADLARPDAVGRIAHDWRVLPVMHRHDRDPAVVRARARAGERRAIDEKRLFADDVPAAADRREHRIGVERGRRADIDEIDRLGRRERCDRLVGAHRWRQTLREPPALGGPLDDGDDR